MVQPCNWPMPFIVTAFPTCSSPTSMPSDRQSGPSSPAGWARDRKGNFLSFSRHLNGQPLVRGRFILDMTSPGAEPCSAALEQRTSPKKADAFPGKEVQHGTTSEL